MTLLSIFLFSHLSTPLINSFLQAAALSAPSLVSISLLLSPSLHVHHSFPVPKITNFFEVPHYPTYVRLSSVLLEDSLPPQHHHLYMYNSVFSTYPGFPRSWKSMEKSCHEKSWKIGGIKSWKFKRSWKSHGNSKGHGKVTEFHYQLHSILSLRSASRSFFRFFTNANDQEGE